MADRDESSISERDSVKVDSASQMTPRPTLPVGRNQNGSVLADRDSAAVSKCHRRQRIGLRTGSDAGPVIERTGRNHVEGGWITRSGRAERIADHQRVEAGMLRRDVRQGQNTIGRSWNIYSIELPL